MLSTKSHQQGHMMCGPASLKIVADYFDINASEKKLARACKTDKWLGTTGKNLVAGAKTIGLQGKIIDESNYAEIKKWLRHGVPVIVDWFSPGQNRPVGKSRIADGHYSVVIGLTPTNIILEDPGPGKKRKIKRRDFMRVWFDFDGSYLKRKENLILRWVIVIAPKNKF